MKKAEFAMKGCESDESVANPEDHSMCSQINREFVESEIASSSQALKAVSPMRFRTIRKFMDPRNLNFWGIKPWSVFDHEL